MFVPDTVAEQMTSATGIILITAPLLRSEVGGFSRMNQAKNARWRNSRATPKSGEKMSR